MSKVVSTKLKEEEHSKLLEECNKKGCTPSAMVRNLILDLLFPDSDSEDEDEEFTIEQLREALELSIEKRSSSQEI